LQNGQEGRADHRCLVRKTRPAKQGISSGKSESLLQQPGAEQNRSTGISIAARGQQKNEALMPGLEEGREADSQLTRTGA
jgi:hypothetical protein